MNKSKKNQKNQKYSGKYNPDKYAIARAIKKNMVMNGNEPTELLNEGTDYNDLSLSNELNNFDASNCNSEGSIDLDSNLQSTKYNNSNQKAKNAESTELTLRPESFDIRVHFQKNKSIYISGVVLALISIFIMASINQCSDIIKLEERTANSQEAIKINSESIKETNKDLNETKLDIYDIKSNQNLINYQINELKQNKK